MSTQSDIEWTNATWNPVTGCNKISRGCKHCYAERMAERLQAMGQPNYRNGFQLTLQPQALELPLHWKKPRLIFVNSMSDLFHEDVPSEYIDQVLGIISQCPQHTFQILTKRSSRLVTEMRSVTWPLNVWMGVSVEDAEHIHRIDELRMVDPSVRFLSLEPLLGPLHNLNLGGIDWVIAGGESGPGARPMQADWVRGIRDQCVAANVPFFFKQWGGVNKKALGRELDGRTWEQMP